MSQEGPAKHFTLKELERHNLGRFDKITDVASINVTYVGLAERGALTAEASWLIYREQTVGTETFRTWANDATFVTVWDDRAAAFPAPAFSNDFSTQFNTSNQYASIGDVPELDIDGTAPYSISAWVKLSVGTERIIYSKQAGSNAAGYRLTIQGGQLRWHLSGGAAGDRIEVRSGDFTGLNDGVWHHVVMRYDGSQSASGVDFFVDDVVDTSPTLTADTLVSSTLNNVAAQISGRNGTTANFGGQIDEVSAWGTDLSTANISEIYNSGTPSDLSAHTDVANLVGWWRMGDGDTFPTLQDNSVSGNDATMTSMASTDIISDTP